MRARHENLDKALVLAKEQLDDLAGTARDKATARLRAARDAVATARDYAAAIAELRLAEAAYARTDVALPARAHDNAWWPYAGFASPAGGGGRRRAPAPSIDDGTDDDDQGGEVVLSPTERSAVDRYRLGAEHMQRAVTAVVACAEGIRFRLGPLRLYAQGSDKPATVPSGPSSLSPGDVSQAAAWILQELPVLERAVDDPDATDEVLDALSKAVGEIEQAHFEFSRAAPRTTTGGRAYELRPAKPTKPARKRRR